MIVAAAIVIFAFWVFLIVASRQRAPTADLYRAGSIGSPEAMTREDKIRQALFIEPFASVLERLLRLDLIQTQANSYHMKLFVLNGSKWPIARTKQLMAFSLGSAYGALALGSMLAWAANEPLMLLMGAIVSIGLALRRFIDAGRKIERRRKQIITALPDMMSKLILLTGAGETVQNAFVRCMEGRQHSDHPLYREWGQAVVSLRNGQSFGEAIERMGRHCAVQEAAIFSTVLLLNYRRGGEHFALAVRELSYTLWEKRKSLARVSGEEASTKLVFPLACILFIMMILIGAPAMMLMG